MITRRSALSLLAAAMLAPAALAADPGPVVSPQLKAIPTAKVADADAKLPQDNDYVVHEWGTFTSFSGSDGVALDFRPLVDEDLPTFVMDRPKQASFNSMRERAYAQGRSVKGEVISKQRMETPVTYFYTDKERIVDASVEFPKGLLTEFYPPVRQFGPAYVKGKTEPLEQSYLRWGKVRLIPAKDALAKTGIDQFIPKVPSGDGEHYAYARETDSAHVQITDPALMTVQREKFLFYRGVGNFDMPVKVAALGGGRFDLTHTSKTPLHYAFLVQIEGNQIRFARFDDIAPSTQMTLPSEPSSLDALSGEMVRALVSDGLFEKEAKAMVKTWKSSWFGEQGTRVLYTLPQSYTDTLLPLHLAPAPKEQLRVMIGRLETLTPEQEKKIENLTSKLGSADPKVRDQTSAEIKKLGRFAEPALTRVAKISDDPETQVRATKLLRELAPSHAVAADAK